MMKNAKRPEATHTASKGLPVRAGSKKKNETSYTSRLLLQKESSGGGVHQLSTSKNKTNTTLVMGQVLATAKLA